MSEPDYRCHNCGLTDCDLLCCSNCKSTVYCSKQCQVEHWKKEHKAICATNRKIIIKMQMIRRAYKSITENKKFNSFIHAYSYYWLDKNNYQGYIKIKFNSVDKKDNMLCVMKGEKDIYPCGISYVEKRKERHNDINKNEIIMEFVASVEYSNDKKSEEKMSITTNTATIESCMHKYHKYSDKKILRKNTLLLLVGDDGYFNIAYV